MLNSQERETLFRRLAPLVDQLSKGQGTATVTATYMLRDATPLDIVKFEATRLGFPRVSGELTFDVEKLAASILASRAAPDLNLIRFQYPHIRKIERVGRSLGPGIVSRSIFATSKEKTGMVLAHCCEAMGVWARDLGEVMDMIQINKTYDFEAQEFLGFDIETETVRGILEEAHESQIIIKVGKGELKIEDDPFA